MDPGSVPLKPFEKSPGFFSVKASRPLVRGEAVVCFRQYSPVGHRTRHSIQIGPCLHIATLESNKIGCDDFLNHSCTPNAFLNVATLEIRALRDITEGEEVLLNYCATEEELLEPFDCHCGNASCYGAVRGFRHLSRSQQEALRGLASPWLKAKYGL